MRRRYVVVFAIVSALAIAGHAQSLGTTQEDPIPSSVEPDRLTEIELLRLQNAALQQQLTNMNVSLTTCRVEAAHPGYTIDPQKGLVKK